jgi:centrosomal protein CEP164
MSAGADPQGSIVLEEEIDPNYVPTEDEVIEYAKWLGMDIDKDKDLFWIAREVGPHLQYNTV